MNFPQRRTTWSVVVVVAVFALSVVVGRHLAGQFSVAIWITALGKWAAVFTAAATTPAWVSAIGTWVAATATVGTIIWAVHVFKSQTLEKAAEKEEKGDQKAEQEQRQSDEKDAAERRAAEAVRVNCYGGGGSSHMSDPQMSGIHVEYINESETPATVTEFSLPGVIITAAELTKLLCSIPGGTTSERIRVATVPFSAVADEFTGRPLHSRTPTIAYRIGGIAWRREGDGPPERL